MLKLLGSVSRGAMSGFVLVVIAAGCSKASIPKVDGTQLGSALNGTGSALTSKATQKSSPSVVPPLSESCGDLQDIQSTKLDQYSGLRVLLPQMNSSFTQERLLEAHRGALEKAIREIVRFLKDKNQKQAAFYVNRLTRERINLTQPKPDQDLSVMLDILQSKEGTPCANAFLTLFYYAFVRELDQFASLSYSEEGGDSSPSLILHPEGEWSLTQSKQFGEVTTVVLRRWEKQEKVSQILQDLKERSSTNKLGPLVLDLRSAAGDDVAFLDEIRSSAASGWFEQPIILWVDGQTRGTAEVFAAEMAERENVLVIGNRTFGYVRKFCQKSETLAPGTPKIEIKIGCEAISNGVNLDDRGLAPDYETPASTESLEEKNRLSRQGIQARRAPGVVPRASRRNPDENLTEKAKSMRGLISTTQPGSLENMVALAIHWKNKVLGISEGVSSDHGESNPLPEEAVLPQTDVLPVVELSEQGVQESFEVQVPEVSREVLVSPETSVPENIQPPSAEEAVHAP